MTGEMVVALGNATADGATVFGHAIRTAEDTRLPLHQSLGKEYAPGELVRLKGNVVPQARQTFSVVGSRPDDGGGYVHGLNEHGVALGLTAPPLRLPAEAGGLQGAELVRLALERSRSARQAVALLIELIERHRLAIGPDGSGHAVLVADAVEAFLVEACGGQWVLHAVERARAAGDVSTIRQDWVRVVSGLAGVAAREGWWPADGSKLDFAAAFAAPGPGGPARTAWIRNTDLVTQHADFSAVRRTLADPTGPVCLAARLRRDPNRPVLGWFAWGPSPASLYLPLAPVGAPPAALRADAGAAPSKFCRALGDLRDRAVRDADFGARLFEEFRLLQERLDQDAEEWTAETAALAQTIARGEIQRRAEFFMQHALERAEAVVDSLAAVAPPVGSVR